MSCYMGNRFAALQVVDLWSLLCKTFLLLISNFLVIWSPGQEKAVAKSKYEEDVYTNNHTVRTALKFVDQVPKRTITNHSLISPSAPCNKTKSNFKAQKFKVRAFTFSYNLYVMWLCFQSVWGSYWQEGSWGYACCHSLIRNSYCTGDAGKENSASRVGNFFVLFSLKT